MPQRTLNSDRYTLAVYDNRGHLIVEHNEVPVDVLIRVLNKANERLKQQGRHQVFNTGIYE